MQVNNSKCRKKIKNMKLLLTMSVTGTASTPKSATEQTTTNLIYDRMPDSSVPKHSSELKIFKVRIPDTQPSFNGKIVAINYELAVYIKHNAWNEYGRGKGVKLPIKVLTPPRPASIFQSLDSNFSSQDHPNQLPPSMLKP